MMEWQVSNYELSIQLRELGVSQHVRHGVLAYCLHDCGRSNCQHSLHLIHKDNDEGGLVGNNYSHRVKKEYFNKNWVRAFTVAELGKMLPCAYYSGGMPNGNFNCFDYVNGSKTLNEKNEADARTKMLIQLIERKVTTVDEINKKLDTLEKEKACDEDSF